MNQLSLAINQKKRIHVQFSSLPPFGRKNRPTTIQVNVVCPVSIKMAPYRKIKCQPLPPRVIIRWPPPWTTMIQIGMMQAIRSTVRFKLSKSTDTHTREPSSIKTNYSTRQKLQKASLPLLPKKLVDKRPIVERK